MRGLATARFWGKRFYTELNLANPADNVKRMIRLSGATRLIQALRA